ncbi:MAG: general stress protein CsbD [Pseudomonadota bacterium]
MDWNVIESNWAEFKGNIKQHWNKINDSQLDFIAGRRDYLVRKIQAAYGISKVEAESQISAWQDVQINIDGHFYESKPFSARQHF